MFTNEIQNQLITFVSDRKWEKFHTEENLANAILTEAAELSECYLWGPDWELREQTEIDKQNEFADILIFCFYYAKKKKYNINKIVSEKIKLNEKKYKKGFNNGN